MVRSFAGKSDAELVALLSSDADAFTEIYNRYWEKLLYVAGLKLRNITMAEEIVQDIFLDIWKRREGIAIHGELEAYLSVAVKYRIINAQAKLKRELSYKSNLHIPPPVVEHSTENWIDEKELRAKLYLLTSSLPEKCRITYYLSREKGLSHKEIADQLSVSQGAVEANLTRTFKLLRAGLQRMMVILFSLFI